MAPAPAPITPQSHSALPLWIGGAVALIVALSIAYWALFSSSAVEQAPKKIGIPYFRQGVSAMVTLKEELAALGHTDVTYVEQEVSPSSPTAMQELAVVIRKMIQEDGVNMIWSDHEHQAKVALEVTKELGREDIPIVYIIRFHDPIEYGLAASFASSGNNATGVAADLSDSVQRTATFFKEIDSSVKKIGIFGAGFQVPTVANRYFLEWKKQAAQFGFEVIEYSTSLPPPQAEAEFHRIAATIKKGDIDAIVHIPGHFFETQEYAEYDLAKRLQVPHAVPYEDLIGGGQFTYATNFEAAGRQSAHIVDKILKGMSPSEIPIEYGEKKLLVLNQYRATESGIEFPESMRYLADEVIETPDVEAGSN